MKTFLRDARIALIAAVIVLAVLFVVSIFTEESEAQLGTRRSLIADRIVANDSLRTDGPVTIRSGIFTGNSAIRGTATFESGAAIDTIVQADLTSSAFVYIQPVFSAAADTTLFRQLWYEVKTDTVFVRQATTSALRAIAYDYLIVY